MNTYGRFLTVTACAVCWLSLSPVTSVADVSTCLNTTGYAFTSNVSFASSGPTTDYLYTNEYASFSTCTPPPPNTGIVSNAYGYAETAIVAGTGLSAYTAASATPGSNNRGTAIVNTNLDFAFSVIADDPNYSGDVALTVHTMYDFGTIRFQVTAPASAAIEFLFLYTLRGSVPHNQDWIGPNGSNLANSNSIITTENEFPVPVGWPLPLKFDAYTRVSSDALSLVDLGQYGSAVAQASVDVTYAFEVPEGFSIVFGYESALGLPPPQLGVIFPQNVPVPPALLMFAPGALWLTSYKRARRKSHASG